MHRLLKKKWFMIAGVLVLVLLAIGITVPVMAASDSTDANSYGNNYIDGPTMTRLAGVLGITPANLSSQLQSGKTLDTLAQEHNVTDEVLENAMVAPYADQLTTEVKYGYMTQAQADTALTNAKNQAGTLIQKDLSGDTGNNGQTDGDNDYYGDCYDYMGGYGYGPGMGWGGYMGPGMMYGWGPNYSNSGTTPSPDTDSGTENSNTYHNNYQGGGFGGWGGMMNGGGMMGGW